MSSICWPKFVLVWVFFMKETGGGDGFTSCVPTNCLPKTQLVSFDRSKNTGAIYVKMEGSLLEEKSSFKMLGLSFSYKFCWDSYIISIAKTASKKSGALIRSMKFLSPEVAPYLCLYLIIQVDLLVILIDCIICLSSFLDVKGSLCRQFLSSHS